MAYINVEDGLPGIIGLLEYRKDTAQPIRELTQVLLRGSSTLSEGERELIATVVSHGNKCTFCATAHSATADILLGEQETTKAVKKNPENAPVSDKMKVLLQIASKVQKSGKLVTQQDVEKAVSTGATELEIHDTVLISALFSLYNRYVDGLGSWTPENPEFYTALAQRLTSRGYIRPEQGYSKLKYKEKEKV